MSIASRVAPMLLAENSAATDSQPYAVKANYLYELELTLKTLEALQRQNQGLDLKLFE